MNMFSLIGIFYFYSSNESNNDEYIFELIFFHKKRLHSVKSEERFSHRTGPPLYSGFLTVYVQVYCSITWLK